MPHWAAFEECVECMPMFATAEKQQRPHSSFREGARQLAESESTVNLGNEEWNGME
jgi:hypothetical protein